MHEILFTATSLPVFRCLAMRTGPLMPSPRMPRSPGTISYVWLNVFSTMILDDSAMLRLMSLRTRRTPPDSACGFSTVLWSVWKDRSPLGFERSAIGMALASPVNGTLSSLFLGLQAARDAGSASSPGRPPSTPPSASGAVPGAGASKEAPERFRWDVPSSALPAVLAALARVLMPLGPVATPVTSPRPSVGSSGVLVREIDGALPVAQAEERGGRLSMSSQHLTSSVLLKCSAAARNIATSLSWITTGLLYKWQRSAFMML
mmetsp:Transcript_56680/g.164381  ORF Transcript_56680/g.164381 Transcript_56680/m.164381 type:complete len:262 (-) Transcript_56680:940-1725(-)